MASPTPVPAEPTPGHGRELYIDAFRGLMVLVMVQGHVCDFLLSPEARAQDLYRFQLTFHGSTAPGFLFASGFVAGLPRAPLSIQATLRRARRLVFIFALGYALHLPYFSFWKTRLAPLDELRGLLACDALQAIAVTQLLVLVVQWIAGRRWTLVTGGLALVVAAAGPLVWATGLSARLGPVLGPYLDAATGSPFPLFPYAAFVLAGTVAGAEIGRQQPRTRLRRGLAWGGLLVVAGWVVAWALGERVDFWTISPAYVLIRLGGLLWLLLLVEALGHWAPPGFRALALLGRETLLVYVWHLQLLYGSVVASSPLRALAGELSFLGAAAVLTAMVPVLFLGAAAWRWVKTVSPHGVRWLVLLLSSWFVYELLTRPW